jgi:hypothetical protein
MELTEPLTDLLRRFAPFCAVLRRFAQFCLVRQRPCRSMAAPKRDRAKMRKIAQNNSPNASDNFPYHKFIAPIHVPNTKIQAQQPPRIRATSRTHGSVRRSAK